MHIDRLRQQPGPPVVVSALKGQADENYNFQGILDNFFRISKFVILTFFPFCFLHPVICTKMFADF